MANPVPDQTPVSGRHPRPDTDPDRHQTPTRLRARTPTDPTTLLNRLRALGEADGLGGEEFILTSGNSNRPRLHPWQTSDPSRRQVIRQRTCPVP